MKFLFLFLDGVGLGPAHSETNPFAQAKMPNLHRLLDGHRLVQNQQTRITTRRATCIPLDACLGVEGRPQSASGQASLLTGQNIPELLGEHYGPKPNTAIRSVLEKNGNLFSKLKRSGFSVSLLNAFPEGYFEAIDSGRRLPGAIAMAARAAGVPLKTTEDLFKGEAISADFTAQGWHDHLKLPNTPVLPPEIAGSHLAKLSEAYDFAFFEYWLSDYIGHRRDMKAALEILETFDQVLGGLLSTWNDEQGLILLTSDHGNLEDLSVRNHTRNPVPACVIGAPTMREAFTQQLHDLTDIYPAVMRFFQKDL